MFVINMYKVHSNKLCSSSHIKGVPAVLLVLTYLIYTKQQLWPFWVWRRRKYRETVPLQRKEEPLSTADTQLSDTLFHKSEGFWNVPVNFELVQFVR